MLMLSDVGLINAFFDIGVFFIGVILGLIFTYQGRKTKAKLLFYYGLSILLMGLSHLGHLVDFITILLTGENIAGLLLIYLTWTTGPISYVILSYVVAELLIPKKKWYYISLVLALSTLFYLDLYIFHWTLNSPLTHIEYPPTPGEELLDSIYWSSFSVRWWHFVWSTGIFVGFGFLYKNIGIKGVIRKKFFYLSFSFIVIGVSQLLRMSMRGTFKDIGENSTWIIYFGGSIFSYLGLKAEHISQDKVTFFREQKICLVCKGKVAGFNIFLCPNCEALYHEDCARALASMENACWVCNETIDKKLLY